MEITKTLTLSTCHIPEFVANALKEEPRTNNFGLSIYPFPYGFWIHVPHEIPATTPPSLAACLRLAKENGCIWLQLDQDAESLDELPIYDW